MLPIATARLVLRSLVPEDAGVVADLIGNWNVVRWLAMPPFPYTLADAESFIFHALAQGQKPGCAAAAITRDDQLIGIAGIDPRKRGMEIDYWLGEPYWGNGYASEAAGALVAAYFAHGHEPHLTSGYFAGNLASARVLTKLGFEKTGRNTTFNKANNRDMPHVHLILTRDRYRILHP